MITLLTKLNSWMRMTAVSKEIPAIILHPLHLNRVSGEKNTPHFFHLRNRTIDPWYSFNTKNQLTHIHPLGSAWCLLQTQYAKKPKNPV